MFNFLMENHMNNVIAFSVSRLHFILQVREDPVFRREGSDIHVNSVLSVTQVKCRSCL